MNRVELIEAEAGIPASKPKKASEPRVRQLQQYGRIAVGQRVEYDRVEFAPTNAAPPWYRWGQKAEIAAAIEATGKNCPKASKPAQRTASVADQPQYTDPIVRARLGLAPL